MEESKDRLMEEVKYYAFGNERRHFMVKGNCLYALTNGKDYQVILPNAREVQFIPEKEGSQSLHLEE